MHGGCFYKIEIYGRYTLRAKAERKQEHALLREMKILTKSIEESINDNKKLFLELVEWSNTKIHLPLKTFSKKKVLPILILN